MPIYDPSTHDDLIDISITLAQPVSGGASFTTLAIIVDGTTPGGGRSAEYANPEEVAADVALTNLNAIAQEIADVAFAQNNPPEKIIFIGVDTTAPETYVDALDDAIAGGVDFYGLGVDSRTPAEIIAVATDIENKADSGIFYLFAFQDDDSDWLTTGIPAAYSAIADFERTVCCYHDDNANDATSDRLDIALMAERLSIDPDVRSAGWNTPVTSVDALTTPFTATQKTYARENNANAALPLGTRTSTFVDPGKNLNSRSVDQIVSADWLRARMGEAVADLITENAERGIKIPVSTSGQAQVGNVIDAVFKAGVAQHHFLAYKLTPLAVTSADISAQRVRFDGEAQFETGLRQVQIGLYFGTDPIA